MALSCTQVSALKNPDRPKLQNLYQPHQRLAVPERVVDFLKNGGKRFFSLGALAYIPFF